MSLESTAEELRRLAHDLRHNPMQDLDNAAENLFLQAKEIEEAAGPYCTWCGARLTEWGHDSDCPILKAKK